MLLLDWGGSSRLEAGATQPAQAQANFFEVLIESCLPCLPWMAQHNRYKIHQKYFLWEIHHEKNDPGLGGLTMRTARSCVMLE